MDKVIELFEVFVSLGHGIKFSSRASEVKSGQLPPIERKESRIDSAGYGRTIEFGKAVILTREPKTTLDFVEWNPTHEYTNLAFVGYTGKQGHEYFTHSSRVSSWRSIIGVPNVYYVIDLHGDIWYVYMGKAE